MAKVVGTNMPVDSELKVAPGVVQVEAGFFAQEQRGRGFLAGAFSGDTEVGRAKGNRAPGLNGLPQYSCPTPFANLRGGR